MSQPIQGYEPAPEGTASSKRYRVYVDKEFLAAFEEEWTACQYMDEQAIAAQADADALQEHFLYSVIDEDSYASQAVVATHAVHPTKTEAAEFVRQVFDRGAIAPRPRLDVEGDLSVRKQLSDASKRRFLRSRK